MSETIEEATPEAAADPAVEAVEVPVVEAPQAPEFNYDDPRFTDFVDVRAGAIADQRLQALIEEAQQHAPPPQAAESDSFVDEFGNFDPAAFAQFLSQRDQQQQTWLDQRLQQLAQPLQAREEAETVQEGNQRLQDILADDISRNGEFPTDPTTGRSTARELVRPLADMIFPSIAQQFGATPRAAEQAMTRASAIVRAIVSEASAHALTTDQNRMTELAGARPELGAAIAGVETISDKPLSGRELALKYGGKASAIRG